VEAGYAPGPDDPGLPMPERWRRRARTVRLLTSQRGGCYSCLPPAPLIPAAPQTSDPWEKAGVMNWRRRPTRPLSLLILCLGFLLSSVPSAVAASAGLDTVAASGSSAPVTPPILTRFGPISFLNIDVHAQSGASGENPSGTASYSLGVASIGPGLSFSGPVTCLKVTGPDSGVGTVTAPTTATLSFRDSATGFFVTLILVDNGGNGADTITSAAGLSPPTASCVASQPIGGPEFGTLTNGRAIVFDTPLLPTSKDQCKHDGWRNFPQFKNQGQCIKFVQDRPPGP
jgi:hypothetical protein